MAYRVENMFSDLGKSGYGGMLYGILSRSTHGCYYRIRHILAFFLLAVERLDAVLGLNNPHLATILLELSPLD